MRGLLTRAICLTVTAILTAAPALALHAADVNNARVWAGPDYTRVVFDLSGPAKYKLSQQDGQVVLELSDSRVAGRLAPTAHGLFKGLDTTSQGNTLRLTASVAANSQPKSFVLGACARHFRRAHNDSGDQSACFRIIHCRCRRQCGRTRARCGECQQQADQPQRCYDPPGGDVAQQSAPGDRRG